MQRILTLGTPTEGVTSYRVTLHFGRTLRTHALVIHGRDALQSWTDIDAAIASIPNAAAAEAGGILLSYGGRDNAQTRELKPIVLLDPSKATDLFVAFKRPATAIDNENTSRAANEEMGRKHGGKRPKSAAAPETAIIAVDGDTATTTDAISGGSTLVATGAVSGVSVSVTCAPEEESPKLEGFQLVLTVPLMNGNTMVATAKRIQEIARALRDVGESLNVTVDVAVTQDTHPNDVTARAHELLLHMNPMMPKATTAASLSSLSTTQTTAAAAPTAATITAVAAAPPPQ